jgi:fatty-acid desaturase
MLLVSVIAAGCIVHQFPNVKEWTSSLAVGFIALVLFLIAELVVGVFLFRLSITDAFVKHDPVLAVAYYGALCLYALMPLMLRSRA